MTKGMKVALALTLALPLAFAGASFATADPAQDAPAGQPTGTSPIAAAPVAVDGAVYPAGQYCDGDCKNLGECDGQCDWDCDGPCANLDGGYRDGECTGAGLCRSAAWCGGECSTVVAQQNENPTYNSPCGPRFRGTLNGSSSCGSCVS